MLHRNIQQLKNEVQRIAQSTRFGKTNLLDGTGGEFSFQVGINNDSFEDRISFDSGEQEATVEALNIADFDFTSRDGARSALEVLDQSQVQVNGIRATLGALQNRLISTTENLGTAIENFSAANSRVRDVDVADASSELAKNQVLQQASVGVLAQANVNPQAALRLIG